jgi:hypothetical protein
MFSTVIAMAIALVPASAHASLAAPKLLTHEQVLQIALKQARSANDPSPTRIEMASGPLKKALRVMGESGAQNPGIDPGVQVDLVVMHGVFHINAPHPPNHLIGGGKVIELILDAHTGTVFDRYQGDRAPSSLRQLGPVTRLR